MYIICGNTNISAYKFVKISTKSRIVNIREHITIYLTCILNSIYVMRRKYLKKRQNNIENNVTVFKLF